MTVYDSSIPAGHLPGNYRLLGALGGLPVVETASLAYDEMCFGVGTQGLLVGEARHFLYRMKQIDLNHECREQAARHIEATATRILGEPWKVASN
jgi:hypothetical protein